MNKKIIKRKKLIVFIAIIIISGGLFYFKNDIWGNETTLSPAGPIMTESEKKENENKICYYSKTEGEEAGDDIKYLEFDVNKENGEVAGFLNYLPAEKSSTKGQIIGVAKDNYLNVLYIAENKGENFTEQKLFQVFEGLIIEAEGGERFDKDGVYYYKDITKLAFGNDGIFAKVNCFEVDKKEVGLE